MALKLYIHPCVHDPPGALHPPSFGQPLRVRIQGPLETIQKLLPNVTWGDFEESFPQLGGVELAKLTHQALYGQDKLNVADEPPPVRDEYLAWVRGTNDIDYYGVTFDHLVPDDDPDPEVLVINIIEVDNEGGIYADGGTYASEVLPFSVNPADYTGKKVLAVPRCCQHKIGTQDRKLINQQVAERKRLMRSPGCVV